MKMVEDNRGMLAGETCLVPVCRVCGSRKLFIRVFEKRKHCGDCGHLIDWNAEGNGEDETV